MPRPKREIDQEVNERIRAVRKAIGKNQEEFAKSLGVSGGSIAQIETNKHNASMQTINTICITYGVNKEWLLDGVGEMFSNHEDSELAKVSATMMNPTPDQMLAMRFVAELKPEVLHEVVVLMRKIFSEEKSVSEGKEKERP